MGEQGRTFEQVLRDPRGQGNVRRMIFEVRDSGDRIVVPPMYLVMNPSSFQKTSSWMINRYQTRGAWIEEVYGENIDEVNCSGSTAAFLTRNGLLGGSGIVESEAYRNFEALISIYSSNGAAHSPTDGQVVKVGSVWMAFDDGVYRGYFSHFAYSEDANRPFSFTLDFNFKIQSTIMALVSKV